MKIEKYYVGIWDATEGAYSHGREGDYLAIDNESGYPWATEKFLSAKKFKTYKEIKNYWDMFPHFDFFEVSMTFKKIERE